MEDRKLPSPVPNSEGPGAPSFWFGDITETVATRQAHYYDFNVSSHEKFVEKLRYIHRNPGSPAHELRALGWKPVRRGLVAKPEDCHPTD